MDNNDILIRIRYALNLKNAQVLEIFKLGGMELTIDEVRKLLTKSVEWYDTEDDEVEENIKCNNKTLDAFLNGLIIYKRGAQESKPEQPQKPVTMTNRNVNNLVMKKLKIALSLTAEEMIEILALTNVTISKGELSAVLRKEGQKNYRDCGDRYVRNFLKGLALKYRADV